MLQFLLNFFIIFTIVAGSVIGGVISITLPAISYHWLIGISTFTALGLLITIGIIFLAITIISFIITFKEIFGGDDGLLFALGIKTNW
jgi:hypothetical protein